MRLRDEFADRPDEAIDSRLHGHPTRPWANSDRPVVLPEPFRSRTFAAESYVLLDVDTAGRAAGCRFLRASAHPELDAFACTLLMRPGYFVAPGTRVLLRNARIAANTPSLKAATRKYPGYPSTTRETGPP